MSAYVSNNEKSVKTDVAEFLFRQRNVGYADNDGRWVLSQLPELYWSNGYLCQLRPGKFLGVFNDMSAVSKVIESAKKQPIVREVVRSIGRVSC